MLKRGWEKLWGLVLEQLKQGLAPEPAAWACALGAYIAVLPLLGLTTLACFAVAWALRLNQVLIHTVASLAYPLQFALLLPFYALGARAFGGPELSLSLGELVEKARNAPLQLIQEYWWVGMHGLAVWAGLGLFVVPLLYLGFRALIVRFAPAQA
jgi:uncharacterized protein (DUF2062 family)